MIPQWLPILKFLLAINDIACGPSAEEPRLVDFSLAEEIGHFKCRSFRCIGAV